RLAKPARSGSCGTYAISAPAAIVRSPPSGSIVPARMRISVDLPAPFGPTNARRSSRAIDMSTLENRFAPPRTTRASFTWAMIGPATQRCSAHDVFGLVFAAIVTAAETERLRERVVERGELEVAFRPDRQIVAWQCARRQAAARRHHVAAPDCARDR